MILQKLIYSAALVWAFQGAPAHAGTALKKQENLRPESLQVECVVASFKSRRRLIVKSADTMVYRSAEYLWSKSPAESCEADAEALRVKIAAAKLGGSLMNTSGFNLDPLKDFAFVSPLKVLEPARLKPECIGPLKMSSYKLRVKAGEDIVYQTSVYSGFTALKRCKRDADEITNTAAVAARHGKKLELQLTDYPRNDFQISSEDVVASPVPTASTSTAHEAVPESGRAPSTEDAAPAQ